MSKSEKRIEAAEGSNQPRFCARSRGGLAIMDTKNAVAALFRLKRANTDLQFHWRSTKMSCPMKPRGLRVNCISPTVLTESAAYPTYFAAEAAPVWWEWKACCRERAR